MRAGNGGLKVAAEIPGWLNTSLWGLVGAVVDEWGPPRVYRELIDTPRLFERYWPLLQWGKSAHSCGLLLSSF